MKAQFVSENINFERNKDPMKTMGVGSWGNKGAKAYEIIKTEFLKDLEETGFEFLILDEEETEDGEFNIKVIVVIPKRKISDRFKKDRTLLKRSIKFRNYLDATFEDGLKSENVYDSIYNLGYEAEYIKVRPVSDDTCRRYGVPWGSVTIDVGVHPYEKMPY